MLQTGKRERERPPEGRVMLKQKLTSEKLSRKRGYIEKISAKKTPKCLSVAIATATPGSGWRWRKSECVSAAPL